MIPDQSVIIEFFGPAGIIISSLIAVIIYQERQKIAERKLNLDLQEKRFADIQIYNSGIEKHRESSDKMADDYKLIVDQNAKLADQLRFTVEQLKAK